MMWSISVEFLRGVCVATDTGKWDKPEWPPHPARLYMAMVAAFFESSHPEDSEELLASRRDAMHWLEAQQDPEILASDASSRTPVTVFVPVNDSVKADQLLATSRSRQPRFFPTSIPEDEVIHFAWQGTIPDKVAEQLESIAFHVSRLGHSSSLVRVWIQRNFELESHRGRLNYWAPSANTEVSTCQMRIISVGDLESMELRFNSDAVEEFVHLETEILESKGKATKTLKQQLEEKFPEGRPKSLRPRGAVSRGYAKKMAAERDVRQTVFDENMMVLAFDDTPTIHLESTLQLAGAVRKKIHDNFVGRHSPEWLGGHQANGAPAVEAHVAVLPLPFVAHQHADGHLMGIAIAFPRSIDERERAVAIREIFERDPDTDEWVLNLNLNHFRKLTGGTVASLPIRLVREMRLNPPRTLLAMTWTEASSVWETVTPVALDRFPKTDRLANREEWNEEVSGIIASSCRNIGLPDPIGIDVHHNPFINGTLKARPSGGGFPTMRARDGKASRYQVHARIEFDTLVQGPVSIGAGRFVGYGFCRPNHSRGSECRGAK
ncbi:CRISPR-associated protein Csb2 [Rhodopirellula rubra]|uniref:CRISPR-associated protein Csb2 n=1 Tax=Aporhodopirellula rubra TaxID=980271 RepID=A0A7W5E1T4_9BACT|nr:type I-U CRISPR-associated protein Csb2 [Aporhodopirellula rubra]MBB3208219.1 CRISPR-associated protein Csb2 [Aporhodopirellula rubra]